MNTPVITSFFSRCVPVNFRKFFRALFYRKLLDDFNKILMFLMLYQEITDGVVFTKFGKRPSQGDLIAVVCFWILRNFSKLHSMEHLWTPVYSFVDQKILQNSSNFWSNILRIIRSMKSLFLELEFLKKFIFGQIWSKKSKLFV